ncbi:MAG: hypothetical protein KDD62_03950 [Bdellovibrionales bacterium]|nr:hypothetical protein [Bdellovibrionales bacterium]
MNLEVDPRHASPQLYAKMFSGLVTKPDTLTGVCGRIIRGTDETAFSKLSFAEGRRLAWISGSNDLLDFIEKPHRELILGIKDEQWLSEQLDKGMRWKLVVLPEGNCVLANWAGVFEQVQRYYPEVADKLLGWANALASEDLVKQIDAKFLAQAVKDDLCHPLHMSTERYMTCDDTALNARLFLWHSLGMNHLYQGNGYTRGGGKEYLTQNKSLAEIRDCVLIDLQVH